LCYTPSFSKKYFADHPGLRLSTKPAPVGTLYILKTGSYEKLGHNFLEREFSIGAVNIFSDYAFLTGFMNTFFAKIFCMFLKNKIHLAGGCKKRLQQIQDIGSVYYAGTSIEKRQRHNICS